MNYNLLKSIASPDFEIVGATIEQLNELEKRVGFVIPEQFKEFYSLYNGLELDRSQLEFLGIGEIIEYSEAYKCPLNLLPFTGGSDPFCICCCENIYGTIFHVCHDTESKFTHRSFDEFLKECIEKYEGFRKERTIFKRLVNFVRLGKWGTEEGEFENYFNFEDLEHSLNHEAANEKAELGLRALQCAKLFPIDDDCYLPRLMEAAFELFSENQLSYVLPWIYGENYYVRNNALSYLQKLPHEISEREYKNYRLEMNQFAKRCYDIIIKNKIQAELHEKVDKVSDLKVIPGDIWLNIEMIFDDRQNVEFDECLMKTVNRLTQNSR